MRFLLMLLVFSMLSSCREPVDLGAFHMGQVCKAGIGTVMEKDPQIMTVYRVEGAVVFLSYIRPDDRLVAQKVQITLS